MAGAAFGFEWLGSPAGDRGGGPEGASVGRMAAMKARMAADDAYDDYR